MRHDHLDEGSSHLMMCDASVMCVLTAAEVQETVDRLDEALQQSVLPELASCNSFHSLTGEDTDCTPVIVGPAYVCILPYATDPTI